MNADTLNTFLKTPPPYIEPYIEPKLLVKQSKLLMFAPAKTGKSILIENLAFCLAEGVPWIGFEIPKPRKVLYIQAEIPYEEFWDRTKRLDSSYGIYGTEAGENLVLAQSTGVKINTQEGFEIYCALIEEVEPEIIIYDPLYKIMKGEDTDQTAGKQVADALDQINYDYGTAQILVHNSRQAQTNQGKSFNFGASEARGHTTITQDWPDTICQFKNTQKGLQFSVELSRHAAMPDPVYVHFDEPSLVMSLGGYGVHKTIKDSIGQGSMSWKVLKKLVMEKCEVNERTVKRNMKTLEEYELVDNPAKGNEKIVRFKGN